MFLNFADYARVITYSGEVSHGGFN